MPAMSEQHVETRKVLWLEHTQHLLHAQDLDLEIVRLQSSIAKLSNKAVDLRHRAAEIRRAAEILGTNRE